MGVYCTSCTHADSLSKSTHASLGLSKWAPFNVRDPLPPLSPLHQWKRDQEELEASLAHVTPETQKKKKHHSIILIPLAAVKCERGHNDV